MTMTMNETYHACLSVFVSVPAKYKGLDCAIKSTFTAHLGDAIKNKPFMMVFSFSEINKPAVLLLGNTKRCGPAMTARIEEAVRRGLSRVRVDCNIGRNS